MADNALIKRLAARSCAVYASQYLSGPDESPYDGKFLVSEHHETWSQLLNERKPNQDKDFLCILAARDHGKCLSGCALIVDTSGRRHKVRDWKGGEVWAFNEETQKFEARWASPAVPKQSAGVNLRTKSGRRVKVSDTHPLLTFSGWKTAAELHLGERIAVPRFIPHQGTTPFSHAWLAGLLVGDGGLTGTSARLTVGDFGTLRAVVRAARSAGWKLSRQSAMQFTLHSDQWLRDVHLMGHDSHTKRVPELLFTAPLEDIADFLAGHFDADGHVGTARGGYAEYYSVSEDLLRDTQHLLLRFGIVGALTQKKGRYKGQSHLSWRLTIRGDSLVKFIEVIKPRGRKRRELARISAVLANRTASSGPALDRFPKEVWDLVQHNGYWFYRNGHTRPNKAYAPTRQKLRKIAEAEQNAELLRHCDSDVMWDEVTELTYEDDVTVYMIQVDGLENYLANDIVNHNSAFFSLAYPLWQVDRNPGLDRNNYGVIFSSKQDQASRILLDILSEVESNPHLAHLLPEKRGRNWGGSMAQFANGHRIYARGYGVRVRGMHPRWVVLDDVLNDSTDLFSEVGRKRNISYYYSAIEPMVVPGGQVIVVGTPFHSGDLYAQLEQDKRVRFHKFSAIKPDGTALWPERYSIRALKAIQQGMTMPGVFSREYLCSPVAAGSSLFPSHLFHNPQTWRDDLTIGMSPKLYEHYGIRTVHMGVDFALSTNTGQDWTVLFVIGVTGNGDRYVLDIVRKRELSFQDQLALIKQTAYQYRVDSIFCESNQGQRIFGEELTRTTDLPIRNVQTGVDKHSDVKGIPRLRYLLERNKYRIPRGDQTSREVTDIWIEELQNHTYEAGRVISTGVHDDTVMAQFVCEKSIIEGSFSFSYEIEEGDEEAFQEEMGFSLDRDALLMEGVYRTGDPDLLEQLDDQLDREGLVLPATDAKGGGWNSVSYLVDKEAAHTENDPELNLKPAPTHSPSKEIKKNSKNVKDVLDVGGAPTAAIMRGLTGY